MACWRAGRDRWRVRGRRTVSGVLVSGWGEPGVEVVKDRFDGRPQLVGDLVLALALAGAASGLGDDDLEDAGERDSPQSCDLGRHCVGLSPVRPVPPQDPPVPESTISGTGHLGESEAA